MKKLFVLVKLCGLLILMGGVSCGSSPSPMEEPPASAESPPPPGEAASAPVQDPNLGPPDQAALDALAAAKEQAEEARKRASDAGGPEYAAEEWEAAEALYTGAGEQEKIDTLEDARESIVRYEQAKAAYEDVYNLSQAQQAKILEEQMRQERAAALDDLAAAKEQAEEARKRASDAGGPEYAAEEWEAAEALYTGAGEQEETDALENIQESIARYGQAKAAYEDVYNLSLAQAKARQERAAAQDALAAAKKQAEEARKRASDAGGPEYAAGEWKAAETLYTAAGKQEKTDTLENTRGSIARYEQAKTAYEDVYNRSQAQAKAQQERAAAQDALAAAKEQAEEARKRASDAGGPEYAAGEWKAAETLYTAAGKQEKTDTPENTRGSIARYEQAKAAYEDVYNRSQAQAKTRQERMRQERAAALDALAAAKKQAEEARKRASDFCGPEYVAEEWEVAEALYTAAGKQEKTDALEDVRESIARYEQTNAAYEDVFNRSLPQYAKALEERILQERAAALAAGIGTRSPERLQAADDTVDRALGLYEAEDYSAAAGSGYLALDMFRLLKMSAETYNVQREIEDHGFKKYDPDTYDAASADALAVADGYDALSHNGGENIKEVLLQAEEVQARFNTLLETGWKRYVLECQASAEAERQAALELKVDVAVRDEFEIAQASYDQAGTFFQADSYKEAAERYFQAELLFVRASGTASGKRRLAEEAIQEAEKKLADSDEIARKAEAILEGNNE